MFRQRHANRLTLVLAVVGWSFGLDIGARNCRVEAFVTRQPLSHRPSSQSQLRKCSEPCSRHRPLLRIKSVTSSLQLSKQDDEYDPRDNFGRSIRGVQSSALKTTVEVGDTVVCKRSLSNLGIVENSSYEVMSIYTQYFDEETQQIVKQPLRSLDDESITTQNKVYMTLFSPEYHSEAVIVTPEEVGLVTVREELGNAAWLAVPGFFWVFLAASFYNTYHERTGGSLGDAFLGR
mmetsp:Transcript_101/g.118  ORF Transcript_101/g.118 Transcript_101/m.118 type:complete len:234 (-) Transcript_101:381-1082(-)